MPSTFIMKRIKSNISWKLLPLDRSNNTKLNEIKTSVLAGNTKIKSLFAGPSGTGKTLAAGELGKSLNREVYKSNLRYIGETEKNLQRLNANRNHNNWILFFDEADALFGKRTKVKDAHDRYATVNSFIKNYEGLTILSVDNLNKIDTHNFDFVIQFKRQSFLQEKILQLKNYLSLK